MPLEERVYSVLLVSSSGKFNAAFQTLLSQSRYDPIQVASTVGKARQLLLEKPYDFVIINTPLPDGSGNQLASDLCGGRETVAMLVLRPDSYVELWGSMAQQGVLTLQKPTSREMAQQALRWMVAFRERLRGSQKKAVSLEEKMEEIRLVNRAKWLLIEKLKMSEPDAHRYIEKQAMDRCVPRTQVAKSILRTYQSSQ